MAVEMETHNALSHFEVVTLFVPDVMAARAFYNRVFAVEEVFGDENSAVLKFDGTMINLLQETQAPILVDPLPVGTGGPRMLLTVRVDDVDTECQRLRELGVPLLNGLMDRPWGRRTAAFADPAGACMGIRPRAGALGARESLT